MEVEWHHQHDPKPYGDGHWARCACGDATFPVTKEAGLSCVPFEFWDDDPWGWEAVATIKARLGTDDISVVRRAVDAAAMSCGREQAIGVA